MFGVLAEAIGGVSDEILKMTGRGIVVVVSLAASICVEIVGLLLLAQNGAAAAAWVTVTAFALQYLVQLGYLTVRTPLGPWPVRRMVIGH